MQVGDDVPCRAVVTAHARAPTDAFDEELGGGESKSKVHIRTQQRNGRKSITTVQGLDSDLDLKKICKAFKKVRGGGVHTPKPSRPVPNALTKG